MIGGKYRNIIQGSEVQLTKKEELDVAIGEFNKWLVDQQEKNIKHPVALASATHYKLVKIHPFADENGRASRLLMNSILIKNSYPPIVIEQGDRNKYFMLLQNIDKSGDIRFFNAFIYNKVAKILEDYIEQAKVI